ncbi:MAG TPA: hypothetical protein VKB76_14570, partial [Ktedonobacterales bacterium]|nr:hypothetical protein [Ktedonobacterales bacterium]
RPVAAPTPMPLLNRSVPASALVLNRHRMLFKTTWTRAVGITAGIVALVVVAVAILVQSLLHPNQTADQWLSTLITGVAWGSTDTLSPIYGFYTTFMQLTITAIPMTAVIAYWFSLRRLFQEWAPWVWLKTFILSVAFILLSLIIQGFLIGAGGTVVNFFQAYPGAIVFAIFVAVLCSGAGIAFGYYFARWPIERIRALNSSVWNDLGLTFICGILGMAVQYIVYNIANSGAQPFDHGYWWIPLAAIAFAIYACWSALRPLNQPIANKNSDQ